MALSLSEEEELELLELEEEEARAGQQAPQESGLRAIPGQLAPILQGVPTRPAENVAGMVKRLALDTFEGFRPPINLEEAKRFLNPNMAQYGPNRFAQDIVEMGREQGNTLAENAVQNPALNRFPKTAATLGTAGALAPMMLMGPKEIPQAVVAGKIVQLAKAAEMGLRGLGSRFGKAAIATMSPASLDAVKARFENPEAVKTALTREQLGNSVVSSQNELSGQIRKLDVAAKNALSGEQSVPKERLIQALNEIKARYIGSSGQAVSGEAKGAIAEIDNAIAGLQKINPLPDKPPISLTTGEKVTTDGINTTRTPVVESFPEETGRTSGMTSERQLKDVMSQYKNINWDDPAGGAKKEVRKIIDALLKSENPEYKEAMKPVADRTKLQSIVEKKLSLKYDPTTGTYATDATAGKWTPGMLEGKKPETSMALKKLGDLTNNDLMGKARMTNFREQFEGGKTQGSRMVQLGRHLAGVPGAAVGAVIDKMGGNMTGALIDVLAKIPSIKSLPAGDLKMLTLALSQALQRRKENAK